MNGLLDLLDESARRQVVAASTRRRFRKGDTLFFAGDPGDTLHLLAKGHVAIRIDTALGDTSTLAILGPGSSFGEQVFLAPDARRTATAVAMDAVETLSLSRGDFEALRDKNPKVDRLLILVLAEQVRRLSAQLIDARHSSVSVRVARVLRDLVQSWGDVDGASDIPITQDELASLTGVTRPTMNRALQELVDKGAIALSRGKLTILDSAVISARAR